MMKQSNFARLRFGESFQSNKAIGVVQIQWSMFCVSSEELTLLVRTEGEGFIRLTVAVSIVIKAIST